MATVSVPKIASNVNRSIVWLDTSVSSKQENFNAQEMLRTSMNHLKAYTVANECENYIRSVPQSHRIIFIVDSQLGQSIVPRIHQLRQVTSIFVYCMNKNNQQWTKTYKKVRKKDVVK